ncbi:MAG: hypothetical protein IPJ71_05985 [Bdellovibrionales bacterium]|nr:hypothetical protein [Bdellovibrionales bacterium]
MCNRLPFFAFAAVLVSCVTIFAGCASLPRGGSVENGDTAGEGPRGLQEKQPIPLKLKGVVGRKEKSWYYSASTAETHEDGQIVRRKEEAVAFTVESRFKSQADGVIVFDAETIEKDGQVDLHDLAFPELNELIEFKLKESGEVLQAGFYPPTSVFFVPPVPLSREAVLIGDTWTIQHEWISMKNGVPLRADLTLIFKGLHQCGKGRCAELEISGEVAIIDAKMKEVKFQNEISGRLLFSIDQGTVVAMRVANKEAMLMGHSFLRVFSCMVGQIVEPPIVVQGFKIKAEACNPEKFSPQFLSNEATSR